MVLVERNLRGHNRVLECDLSRWTHSTARPAARATCSTSGSAWPSSSPPTSSHNDRVAGYLYALHAHHHNGRKHAEQKPIVLHQSHDLPSRDAYARLADQVHKLDVDGIVCYQDYTAMGLILELITRGLSVPDSVAVVGFDDLPIGSSFTIAVTSYAYPAEGMAEQAVRLMRERLKDPTRPPIKVVVPGRLIVRASSAGDTATE